MNQLPLCVLTDCFTYTNSFIFQNISLLTLLQEFATYTSVPLAIEWFFTDVSLAIETRFQNIAVMAVWHKRWKSHILVAMTNLVPLAIWTTQNVLEVVDHTLIDTDMPWTYRNWNTSVILNRSRQCIWNVLFQSEIIYCSAVTYLTRWFVDIRKTEFKNLMRFLKVIYWTSHLNIIFDALMQEFHAVNQTSALEF